MSTKRVLQQIQGFRVYTANPKRWAEQNYEILGFDWDVNSVGTASVFIWPLDCDPEDLEEELLVSGVSFEPETRDM